MKRISTRVFCMATALLTFGCKPERQTTRSYPSESRSITQPSSEMAPPPPQTREGFSTSNAGTQTMPAPSMTPAPPPMQSPPPSTAIPSGQYKILVSVETLDANARPIGQFRIPGILWITPVQGSPNAVDIAFKVGEVFSATTPGAFSYHTNGALSTLSGVRSDSANAVPLATVRAQGSRLDFAANRPTNEAEMALMPNIYKNLFLVEAGVMAMPRAIISCEGSVESSGGNLIGSLIMSGINSSSNRAGAPNSGIRAQFTTVP